MQSWAKNKPLSFLKDKEFGNPSDIHGLIYILFDKKEDEVALYRIIELLD